jgi:regulator of nucleoside diphosphate kinase
MSRSAIVVTRGNAQCLRVLARMEIAADLGVQLAALYQKLDGAFVVDDAGVPRGVVTIGSRVVYYDPKHETEYCVALVYPWNGAPREGRVSVTSPLGIALLGTRIGMSLRYRPDPESDRVSRIDVIDVPYQPEACGRV